MTRSPLVSFLVYEYVRAPFFPLKLGSRYHLTELHVALAVVGFVVFARDVNSSWLLSKLPGGHSIRVHYF